MSENIYQKILSIQGDVLYGLKKEEENKFHRYKYVSEYDILKLLKPLLDKKKLLISFSDDFNFPLEETKVVDSNGKLEWKIKFLKKIELINVEKIDEKLCFYNWACAQGTDPAKAKGSADTYSLKYFLIKFFLLPTYDNLDPDLLRA